MDDERGIILSSSTCRLWELSDSAMQKKSLEERIEEAIREEILIAPYDPNWPQLFESEAAFLKRILPKSIVIRIEHFGSTAVQGLAAKSIIDMLVEVSSLAETQEQIVPILEAAGYDYFWRTDVSPAYAWFIKRDSQGKRTHHIHMVESDSNLWERLYFRDYLREFPEEAGNYAELKQSLAEKFPHDRIAYTEAKAEYVVAITERAKRYYSVR
jgi:GrpB-like predicted nucleotidyltransferase (UPF0157 family)